MNSTSVCVARDVREAVHLCTHELEARNIDLFPLSEPLSPVFKRAERREREKRAHADDVAQGVPLI